jgi:hypothetical protein
MTDTTFSDADAKLLAELQQRQATAALVSRRAVLAPVIEALPSSEQVCAAIAAMRAARTSVDLDTAARLDRLALILENDLLAVLASVTDGAAQA